MSFYNNKKNKSRGMTYLELVMVISIFAMMSAVTLFNYKNFQSNNNYRNNTSLFESV